MTHRESKAISDRINRKAEKDANMKAYTDCMGLDDLVLLHSIAKREGERLTSNAAHYAKAIRKRKIEAKKLTGSGDDRRTRIADGTETGGHVEASPAVDGVPAGGEHGRRRPGDNA